MAFPWIFANLAAGNQPASKLDDNFNALGTYATVPCAASGTNAITLTPAAGAPTISAYNQLQAYRFIAAATSTGAVTIQVLAIGFLPAYLPSVTGPTAAGTGNVVIGESYDAIYDVALNSGGGGFHLYNVIPPSSTSPIKHYYGSFSTNSTLTVAIPLDDTIPQSTEGTQIISVSVTTTSATQRVRLYFNGLVSTNSGSAIAAIFRGTTCIQVSARSFDTAGGQLDMFSCGPIEEVPGSGTFTYSVRAGQSIGNIYTNGLVSGRLFGGATSCTLAIDVWEP